MFDVWCYPIKDDRGIFTEMPDAEYFGSWRQFDPFPDDIDMSVLMEFEAAKYQDADEFTALVLED